MIHPVMQLFQVVIFISHYDSSCWFLSHSSFFKGEGAVFILKKRECIASWDRVLITAAAWCIIIMIHFNSRQQNHHGFYSFFTHSSSYWFIVLFLSTETRAAFSLKQTGDWKWTHLLLLPFMTHFYDADGDGGSSLSFNPQELHHYSDAFLYQSLPDALFL